MDDIYQKYVDEIQNSIDSHLDGLKQKYQNQVSQYKQDLIKELLDSYTIRYKEVLDEHKKDLEILKIKLKGFPQSSQELRLKNRELSFEKRISSMKINTEAAITSILRLQNK